MNPKIKEIIIKVGSTIGGAALLALGSFLSRIFEPIFKWFTFTFLKWLISITKSKTLRSLYEELRKGYNFNQSPYYNEDSYNENKDGNGPLQ